jgi:hypothetical protein
MNRSNWYVSRPAFQTQITTLREYIDQIEDKDSRQVTYQGRRGAMVVDAVTSRQRQYNTRVLKIVNSWSSTVPEGSLKELIAHPMDQKLFGLRDGESQSITAVAKGLLQFGEDFHIQGEDLVCNSWASAVENFRFAPKLDPYVGRVDGIGVALFAYLRKMCGVDAIKPDLRVRQRLQSMGFEVPEGSHALMLLCEILADELAIPKSKFDDYLWRETN